MKYSKQIQSGQIECCLDKILKSPAFQTSKTLCKFLKFIVQKKVDGCESELKEYIIGIYVLKKEKDFNPQYDSLVRTHANRLRNALANYYKNGGQDDDIVISIPKGCYIPEFTFKEIKNRTQVQSVVPLKSLDEHLPVLHIGPFKLYNIESEKIYPDLFEEQLVVELSKFQNVKVVSNIKLSDQIAVQTTDTNEIHYHLTGSFRLFNNTIRINIQLVNSITATTCWVQSYVFKYPDHSIFELHDAITCKIASLLADENGILFCYQNNRLGLRNRTDYSIYNQCIQAYYNYSNSYHPDKRQYAIEYHSSALELYNESSIINALIAKLHTDAYIDSINGSAGLHKQKSIEYAKRAIQIDQYCQYAQNAIGWAYLISKNKEEAANSFYKCYQLNNNSSKMLSNLSFGLICIGEFENGRNCMERAIELDNENLILSKCSKVLLAVKDNDLDLAFNIIKNDTYSYYSVFRILQLAVLNKFNPTQNKITEADVYLMKNAGQLLSKLFPDYSLKDSIETLLKNR